MPLYEYLCKEDGTKIELLRTMSQADAPVEDPEGKGRTFSRVLSTFEAKAGTGTASSAPACPSCCSGGMCGLT
ncbi:MAG: hypothetical protein KAS72_05885 [Phycisphaerales bacterium]|nr:hypothetical protein [Phycisphaerales bacterium]